MWNCELFTISFIFFKEKIESNETIRPDDVYDIDEENDENEKNWKFIFEENKMRIKEIVIMFTLIFLNGVLGNKIY